MNMSYASSSLYVGDLHPDVNEEILTNVFKEAGNIVSIRICRDHSTKKSLGYGYVNFSSPQEAERALDALNYSILNGQQIRIMWSQRDPSVRKSGKGNVFVKNLDASIDNKALYDTFSSFGDILSCKVFQRHTKKQVTTEDGKVEEKLEITGFGFVHYEKQESAEAAVAKMNGMLLNGKKIFVGFFQKKEQRLNIKSSDKEYTNIYVKNLDTSIEDEEFMTIFSKFGDIQHGEVMRDENGNHKGFGFINYADPDAASRAVDAMNNQELKGKKVFVGRAQKRTERQNILREKREKMEAEKAQKYQGVNLYVKNLDDTIDEEKLKAEFGKYGKIQNAVIMTDKDSTNKKGFGFVCFENPEDATRAIQDMHGKMVGSKPLYVALAEKKEIRQAKLRAQHSIKAPMGYAMPSYPVVYNPLPMGRGGFPVQPIVQSRFVRPGLPGRGYPQAPVQQPQQPQPQHPIGRGNSSRGGRGGRGGQSNQPNARANNQNKGVKYNQNVRNQPQQQAPQQVQPKQVTAPQQPVQTVQPTQPDQASILANLGNMNADDQKTTLGELLYPRIAEKHPDLAGKITGMLLDLDNGELVHYLEDNVALEAQVNEAIKVLSETENQSD